MKKFAAIAFMTLVATSACGGRTANPVMVTQYGDVHKSCRTLEFEMQNAQAEMQRLLPQTDKTGKNVALGVTGAFFLVPLFFMDFKQGEQTEYEAYRQRYMYLSTVAMDKKCDVKPVAYPSVRQMKEQYESRQTTPAAR